MKATTNPQSGPLQEMLQTDSISFQLLHDSICEKHKQ